MADTLRLNPHVAELPLYNAGMNIAVARSKTGLTDIAALASNENPYGCSPKVTAALASLDPSRYADPACVILRDALSRKIGVAGNRIVIGNGSEEMIAAVCRAVLRPDATVVAMIPGFGLHEIEPRANGAKIIKIPMTKDLRFDLEAMTTALREKPSIFFISSPSNPVGPALRQDQLSGLIAAVPKETLLVFDEAYFEFCDGNTPDGLKTLADSAISWVVLRTFSKAYGLAGLRVGWALAPDWLTPGLNLFRGVGNVNAIAQAAAAAAVEDQVFVDRVVAETHAERAFLARHLARLGLHFVPGFGNFLLTRFPDAEAKSAAKFIDFAMRKRGIWLRPVGEPGFANWSRIGLGNRAENELLVRFLEGFLK